MSEVEKTSHDGHRDRMRERLNQRGADGMSPTDVLELLLFQSIPRADVRVLAEALLKKFGSFAQVLGAPVSQLAKVPGIGLKTAEFLHMMPHFARYYLDDLAVNHKRIFDIETSYEQMRHKFLGRTKECIAVILLDSRGHMVYDGIVCEGAVSQVPLYVRSLVQLCIEFNADSVILGHNHTSGNPAPSRQDIVATKELQLALDGVYVSLEDHVIFTDTDYTSMRRSGWLTDVTAAAERFRKDMIISAREAEEALDFARED